MTNPLCEMLGISVPIVQAPMAGAVGARLASAVSNAGGLGTLPLWRADATGVRVAVGEMMALTEEPFAVNLNMEFPQEAQLDACLAERVPVISFFWQDASSLVPRAKAAGAKVIYSAGDAVDAARAVSYGADIICAQGWESGGHVRGTVSTLALVPAIKDAVGDVPVIAAGAIADGRGFAAARALGADGVWVGTRFLAASEAEIHPDYLARLLAAGENDTVHCDNLYDVGWPDAPHRALANSTSKDWIKAGRPPMGQRAGEGDVLATTTAGGKIQRYQSTTPGPSFDGNIEALSLWAGQGVGLVREVKPAAEIVHEIYADGMAILANLGK